MKEREIMRLWMILDSVFVQYPDDTIPRTNNSIEQFFRKNRRNVRKRYGNIVTGNVLAKIGEPLALFQNMGNEKY